MNEHYISTKETNKVKLTHVYLSHCLNSIDRSKHNRLIDLGCGHGNHSILAASLGFKVTGIDGREDRIPFKEKSVKWKIDNVESVNLKEFDIVLASGIMYHLPFDEQVKLLEKVYRADVKYLIINTHFAILNDEQDPINDSFKEHLIKVKMATDDYKGAMYNERDNYKARSGAALNNKYSFWFTFQSLIDVIINHTHFNVTVLKPFIFDDRCWLLCNKKDI